MRKSKIIYLFNIIIFIFILIYFNNYQYESKYSDEKEIIGVVTKVTNNLDNIKLIIEGKEKIIATCYKCEFNDKVGSIVKLKGEFQEIKENTNFNLFNYKKYLMSLGIHKSFVFNHYEYIKNSNNFIYKTYNKMNSKINGLKSNYFLKAMILGNTNEIDENIYENYKTNGIIHLFSISGMHIGIIVLILTSLLKKKLGNYSYLIIFPIIIFYMLIINSNSIIRSVLMYIALTLNRIFKLKLSSINILFYLFAISVFINPYVIYNTGFLLSYVVTFFLILSAKKISKINNYIFKLFFISLISFLAGLPIIINSNFEFNLLTPLINIIVVPFVSIILFPLSILTMIFPFLDNILVFLLNGFNNLNNIFSNNSLIINVQYLNIYLIIIYYLIFMAFFIKSKHIILLFIYLCFLINLKYINFNSYLIMIDVGQGDSILIKNYFGENILIDAGSKENSAKNIIIPYLKSIGVTTIDRLIISHGDKDHAIGAVDIISNLKVKEVYLNSYSDSEYEKEIKSITDPYLVDKNRYLNEHIYLLNYHDKSENDDSLITYLVDYKVLLMGDASSKIEEKIDISDINILKVGHHGSKTSSDENFISKLKPKISLISVGLKNKYGHPSKEVIERLKNSFVLMTSVNGMIKINLKTLKYESRF